jgi:2,3-dihydroxybiphenyl 1,2-dioxygenase
MDMQSLGYVGIKTADLDDWQTYATRFLGMQLVDKSANTRTFRMDDRRQRLVVEKSNDEGPGFFGWEVADLGALDHIAARLEQHGVAVTRGTRALADERHVRDLISFIDPVGNRVEAFCGPETASDAFQPGRSISGFRTGPLGMGHAVLTCKNIDDVLPFYTQVLGFKLSDYILQPFKAYFMHVNPRHHSLAFIETGTNGIHHLMVELYNLDDVGQGYDLALCKPEMIGTTFGRHVNDHMTSFYTYSPSKFLFEYGWGGRSIDPDNWTPHERTEGPSLWGHDRAWLPPDKRLEARDLRMRMAEAGVREPLNVIEGNHRVAPGTCIWWDAAKGTKASA